MEFRTVYQSLSSVKYNSEIDNGFYTNIAEVILQIKRKTNTSN